MKKVENKESAEENKKVKKVTVENKETQKVEKKVKKEEKKEIDEVSKAKVETILKKAKENGKITYGELANELEDTNPDQIDKVFDAFEDLGVSVLQDDDLDVEPDLEDLQDVEDI